MENHYPIADLLSSIRDKSNQLFYAATPMSKSRQIFKHVFNSSSVKYIRILSTQELSKRALAFVCFVKDCGSSNLRSIRTDGVDDIRVMLKKAECIACKIIATTCQRYGEHNPDFFGWCMYKFNRDPVFICNEMLVTLFTDDERVRINRMCVDIANSFDSRDKAIKFIHYPVSEFIREFEAPRQSRHTFFAKVPSVILTYPKEQERAEYVADIPQEYKCQICLDPFFNPVIVDSGDIFCEECITRWIEANGMKNPAAGSNGSNIKSLIPAKHVWLLMKQYRRDE
jgi:hypothetical protein